jgi:hypothetical protein
MSTTIAGVIYERSTGKVTGKTVLEANLVFQNTVLNTLNASVAVKQVNNNVFQSVIQIQNVTFNNNMSLIGATAFQDCINLSQITFGTGIRTISNHAFRRCTKITSLDFPYGITLITSGSFTECTALTSFNLPSSLTEVTDSCFDGCTNAQTITVNKKLSNFNIIVDSMYDNVAAKYKLTRLDLNFAGNITAGMLKVKTSLKTLNILQNVTSVGVTSFLDYTNLETVDASEAAGLRHLDANSFDGCSKLKVLTFRDGLTFIGASAFVDCTGLTSINFPSTIQTITSQCFRNCTGLTEIIFNKHTSNTTKLLISDGPFTGCVNIKSLNLHSNITVVSNGAFSNCTGLTYLQMDFPYANVSGIIDGMNLISLKTLDLFNNVVPIMSYGTGTTSKPLEKLILRGLDNIGVSAFSAQLLLKEVTIQGETSNKGATISTGAFSGCTSLTYLQMDYVINIDSTAFSGCTSLTRIFINDYLLETIGSNAFANCSGLTEFSIGNNEGFHKLTLIGVSAFAFCAKLANLPSMYNVKVINDSVFRSCVALTSIQLGLNITSVNNLAFTGCTSITEVTLNQCNYLSNLSSIVASMPLNKIRFNYNNNNNGPAQALGKKLSLKTVILDNINAIGASAFVDHILITSIFIPQNCASINAGAFQGCTGLTYFEINETSSMIFIGDYAFAGCINLTTFIFRSTLLSIAGSAFLGCTGLSVISFLGNNILNIGIGAFVGCTLLKSVSLPYSLTTIGDNAFQNCIGLTNVTIQPSSVLQKIGNSAFQDCVGLTSVIDNNASKLTEIGINAFQGCTMLNNINILNSVITINNFAFKDCTGLTHVTINAACGLTLIGTNAFENCSKLNSIIFSNKLVTIGSSSFKGCVSLTNIVCPSSVLSINTDAFQGCIGLTIFTMAGVRSIQSNAFQGCIGLTSIVLPSTGASVNSSAFLGCTNIAQLQVNSYLSNLSSIVEPMNLTDLSLNNFGRVVILNNKTTLRNVAITGITTIVPGAFQDLTALNSVSINGSNIDIGLVSGNVQVIVGGIVVGTTYSNYAGAFEDCIGLTSIIMSNIQEINSNTFSGCIGLTSVTLPSSVASVDSSAFTGCTNIAQLQVNSYISNLSAVVAPMNLTDLSLNNVGRVNILKHKTTLRNVAITGITSIIPDAFRDLTALNSVSINGTTVTIGASNNTLGVFQGCIGLTSITISNVRTIWNNAFSGCIGLTSVILPSTVIAVHSSAFSGCTNITTFKTGIYLDNYYDIVRDMSLNNLDLSYNGILGKVQSQKIDDIKLSGITDIDDSAFALCINVTKIILSQELRNIRNNLFYGCNKLSEITLPTTSLTSIGTQAFQDCLSLKEVSIPASVNTLGNKIFQGCSGLTKITINKTYPNLAYALYGLDNTGLEVDFNFNGNVPNGALYNKSGITRVIIRNIIKSINKSAFEGCNGLTSIIFSSPNTGLSLLDNKAFANCINLQVINIPAGVTQISDYTFLNCTSLKTVIIPASVKTIGTYAFSGCSGLTGVSFLNTFLNTNSALVKIGDFAFNNCVNLETISLPSHFRIVNENVFEGCVKLAKY